MGHFAEILVLSKTVATFGLAFVLLHGASTAWAASSANDKPLPPSIAVQRASLEPPAVITDRIGGLRIIITQVNYPGVPDRASCRFVVRAVNQGHERIATHALLRTFNGDKEVLNTWMVPTGELAPGQSSERLYSCKTAQYLQIDRQSLNGWPGRCEINGEERTPCPLSVGVEANLNLIAKE